VAAKESVARFIERLSLTPLILHEQANEGQTIIEKFESHSSVSFAVVLLTPDDLGQRKITGRLKAKG
jgi:predicted nucleotide-binding protein